MEIVLLADANSVYVACSESEGDEDDSGDDEALAEKLAEYEMRADSDTGAVK